MNLSHAPVMLDVVGTTLTAADIRRIAHPMTGGIILFARNFTRSRAADGAAHRGDPGRCATTC